MDAIATYSDKSHYGTRRYRLFADHIVVSHRDAIAGESEMTLRLKDLDPDYATVAIRSRFFYAGLWLAPIPWLIYWALLELTRLDPFGRFAGLFLGLGFAGLFMVAIGLRKQRFVRFRTRAGVPALDVFREGPTRAQFDGFVAKLTSLIRALPA